MNIISADGTMTSDSGKVYGLNINQSGGVFGFVSFIFLAYFEIHLMYECERELPLNEIWCCRIDFRCSHKTKASFVEAGSAPCHCEWLMD